MATIDCSGFDELIKQLNAEHKDVDERCKKALKAAGKIAVREMQDCVPVRSGLLKSSIKAKAPKKDSDSGGWTMDVYPDGTRADGQDFAKIGSVLEHGRSNMKPRPWMKPAMERAKGDIENTIREVLTNG